MAVVCVQASVKARLLAKYHNAGRSAHKVILARVLSRSHAIEI